MVRNESRWGKRCALAALALATVIGAWEGYLRSFSPVAYLDPARKESGEEWTRLLHRRSEIPGLSYELAPGVDRELSGVRVRTNARGMRGGELRPSSPNHVRIAVIGDSYTFGLGVREEQTFCHRLERLLELAPESVATGRTFEVMNLGVSGYSTRDEALLLEHRALALGPSLVVLAYTLNDPEIDPIMPLHAHFAPSAWWHRSHAMRWIARRWERRRLAGLDGGRYLDSLYADARKWESVVHGFEGMARAAASASVPLLLTVFPFAAPGDAWTSYGHRGRHGLVRRAGETAGFEVLDLLPAFERHTPLEVRLAEHDEHPSPLGHRIAAEAILEKLREVDRLRRAVWGDTDR